MASRASGGGRLFFETLLGILPPLIGILVSIIIAVSAWNEPYQEGVSRISWINDNGHMTELYSIFLPLTTLYTISAFIASFRFRLMNFEGLEILYVVFLLLPTISLTLSTLILCIAYTKFYQKVNPSGFLFDITIASLFTTLISVFMIEFYIAFANFQQKERDRARPS